MMAESNSEKVDSILVEFTPRSGLREAAFPTIPATDIETASRRALDSAMQAIRRMAQRMGETMQVIHAGPAALEIEFGIKLDAEAGAMIAERRDEGAISVRMLWERPEKPVPSLPPLGGRE